MIDMASSVVEGSYVKMESSRLLGKEFPHDDSITLLLVAQSAAYARNIILQHIILCMDHLLLCPWFFLPSPLPAPPPPPPHLPSRAQHHACPVYCRPPDAHHRMVCSLTAWHGS